MSSEHNAVVQQPFGSASSGGGGIEIRPMAQSDCDFVAGVLVEAFESKMDHAVGKENFGVFKNGFALELSTRPAGGLKNIYVGWFEGRQAGALTLAYHGEKIKSGDTSFPGLGCRPAMGLCCLECTIGGESVPAGSCYIDSVGVAEWGRGRGVGNMFMQHADNDARAHGCTRIYLWVAEDNRARHLYERQGFHVAQRNSSSILKCGTGIKTFLKMEKSL